MFPLKPSIIFAVLSANNFIELMTINGSNNTFYSHQPIVIINTCRQLCFNDIFLGLNRKISMTNFNLKIFLKKLFFFVIYFSLKLILFFFICLEVLM